MAMAEGTPHKRSLTSEVGELELKFQVPAAVLPSLRGALLAHGARRVHLQAHYFDTVDGLLARQGIALRLRREGRNWIQTLKAAGNGAVHRLEHQVRVAVPVREAPALDWHRHDGSPAGNVLGAALAGVPGAVLVERCATQVERLHCLLRGAEGGQIEAALDLGTARAGARSVPIAELELEHKGGPVQGLFDLALAWQLHGGLWLCTISKAERAARLLAPAAEPLARKVRAPRLDAGMDAAALLRALLQSAIEQVLVNASEVAEGVTAAETVHQLRIGLRRLRTVLRELAALSPAIAPEWERELSHAFFALGQARDQEAVAATVRPLLQAAGAPLLAWHAPPAPDLAAAVRGAGFQSTLIATLALAHAGAEQFAPLAPQAAREFVAARLDALHRRVTRDGRRFDGLEPAAQHRVRKRVKRLRYLAEMTAALLPREALRSYLERLTAAQDALGRHHDVAVAADAFHADAALHPQAWFAAGFLQAYLATTARSARKALRALAVSGKCPR
jgi:triphosphatase